MSDSSQRTWKGQFWLMWTSWWENRIIGVHGTVVFRRGHPVFNVDSIQCSVWPFSVWHCRTENRMKAPPGGHLLPQCPVTQCNTLVHTSTLSTH